MQTSSNGARETFDPDSGLFRRFAVMAARFPDHPALIEGDRQLSYTEALRRVEAVSAWLGQNGLRPGELVALVAGRRIETITAMLGVLHAGGAFLPLDPAYSREQLSFIFADAAPKAVLAAPDYLDLARALAPQGLPITDLTGLTDPSGAVEALRHGADPACIYYTSGSTGRPKGVIIPQRAILRLGFGQPHWPGGPGEVMLHSSTIAADASGVEIWLALLTGGAVAVVPGPKPSVSALVQAIRRHQPTALSCYTGIFHLLIEHAVDHLGSFRRIFAGGDVMSVSHARRLLERWPDLELWNLYGPTEATMYCTMQQVTSQLLGEGSIPIGRSEPQGEAFLVTETLEPGSQGETGQLTIAGPGVASGYLARPEQTAASFIDDPRPGRQGKVYLTGDMVRLRADGGFEFLGRADRQVKIGGRRIELDEIEHVLRQHAEVANAAVVLAQTPHGDRRIVAFVKPRGMMPADLESFLDLLIGRLRSDLPEGMLPRHFHLIAELPLTEANKVDRKALTRLAELDLSHTPALAPAPSSGFAKIIAEVWNQILHCGPVGPEVTFFAAGGSSLQLLDAHAALQRRTGLDFDVTLLFEAPKLGDLAERLASLQRAPLPEGEATQAEKATGKDPGAATGKDSNDEADKAPDKGAGIGSGSIAIIGLAGRFPGAASVAEFWQHLRAGDNLIRRFAADEIEDSFTDAERAQPNYVAARPSLPNVEMFDAGFFGMYPREAAATDPQGRIFLEISHEALEDAGHDPRRFAGRIGVYAGASLSTYLINNLLADRSHAEAVLSGYQLDHFAELTGNIQDGVATRTAFKLGLTGPAFSVGTACSTSMTAIAQAVLALRSGQCEMALAGGVSITFPQKRGYFSLEGGMASADGICRPFDQDASGTVFGHGAGVIVLRPLEAALAAGDRILAVIRGVGINNDGSDKIAYTAPSVKGQEAAIRMAWEDAGLSPASAGYVECHGTATPLGDPIELRSLSLAFGPGSGPQTCALGSVKGNIGHLDAAAGVMGAIKTALILSHREIPPVANFRALNPRIELESTPFVVPTSVQPWQSAGPRRAGLSAFGVGGTNVHLVLEEPPPPTEAPARSGWQILPLSARSPEALRAMHVQMADAVGEAASLADVALTLQTGRSEFPFRAVIAAQTGAVAAEQLRRAAPARRALESPLGAAFMFPGQGSQYPGMGSGLYAADPSYAEVIDTGAEILRPLIGLDLRPMLTGSDLPPDEAARALRETRLTQPALYLTQIATARLWQARGVTPAAMIGHSVGELAAATIGGTLSFEAGLKIIARRGQLMQDQPSGAMLSVRASLEQLAPYLDQDCELAAQNAPKLQVVAGPDAAITALAARLETAGLPAARLHTSHAFHSRMMEPVTQALTQEIAGLSLAPPNVPWVSCVTGDWIRAEEATDPAYWAAQARQPVLFAKALARLAERGALTFLEIGAGGVLSAFAAQVLPKDGQHIIQSLPDHNRAVSDEQAMALAFGRLWASGLPLDWSLSGPRGSRRVALPTYPFERKRHWVEAPPPLRRAAERAASQHLAPSANLTLSKAEPAPAVAALAAAPASLTAFGPASAVPATSQVPGLSAVPSAQRTASPLGLNALAVATEPFHGPSPAQDGSALPGPSVPPSPFYESAMPALTDRKPRLTAELLAILSDLSGEDLLPEDAGASFLELGFDSLFLGQFTQRLARDYRVELTFRQLLASYPGPAALAEHLDAVLPSHPVEQISVAAAATAPALPVTPAVTFSVAQDPAGSASAPAFPAPAFLPAPAAISAGDGLTQLMQSQLQVLQSVMAQQLATFGFNSGAAFPAAMSGGSSAAALQSTGASQPSALAQAAASPEAVRIGQPSQEDAKAASAAPTREPHREAAKPVRSFSIGRATNAGGGELSPAQRLWVADLIRRTEARFPKSKAYTQRYRASMADPRSVAGYRPEWKEMVFPIVAERSKGAYIHDLDGNALIDFVNGFGTTAFGHSPDFVNEALIRQIERGYAIGPQCDLAGPVAERFARVTGHDRATFCNTGSEAVMAAMRLARAVTGRDKVVVFSNDYHGQFDEVLVKGRASGEVSALPIAPGIPRSGLGNMVVLPYGGAAALTWLEANASDVAAVLVEPVQSRHPELRPAEFVREIRRLTEASGTALVMDEVVTGFRTGARGMQGIWGIDADLATYGKVIGGGMPVGMLAGRKRFMDALDGGFWRFGDDSGPETSPTFFAGTFVRHPLVVASVEAVLDHLEAGGTEQLEATSERTQALAERLNGMLAARGLPRLIEGYSSWFTLNLGSHDPNAVLIFPLLRLYGINVQVGYNCIATTAHGEMEFEAFAKGFEAALDELRSVGILSSPQQDKPRLAETKAEDVARQDFPLTDAQAEVWMTSQLFDEASSAFNEGASLTLRGPLDEPALRRAFDRVIARHDGLRQRFAPSGESFTILPPFSLDLPLIDLSSSTDPEAQLAELLKEDAVTPIDLINGPPLRAMLIRRGETDHILSITAHHIVCDGWSYNTLFTDLARLYTEETSGLAANLPPAPSFAAHALSAPGPRPETIAYWQGIYRDLPDLPDLPTDQPRGATRSWAGATLTRTIPGEVMKAARKAGARHGCTLFATLFGALQLVLARLSGSDDVVLAVPTGGQAQLADQGLVGHLVNLLPVRAPLDRHASIGAHLERVRDAVSGAFDHGDCTYGTLVRELGVERSLNRLPLTEVQFNLEKLAEALPMAGLTAEPQPNPKAAVNFDLFFNVVERRDGLRVDVDYNLGLYSAQTVERWLDHLERVLIALAADSSQLAGTLPMLSPDKLAELERGLPPTPAQPAQDMLAALIDARAKSMPDAIAVESRQTQFSYSELSRLSSRIAAALLRRVPGHGQRIALAIPRGAEYVAAMLGVMKAGHAYVPLDIEQPKARLSQVVSAADAALVLYEGDAPDWLESVPALSLAEAKGAADAPDLPTIAPEDSAYVIFTSGSTGVPKGVEISHGALVNLLGSVLIEPGFTKTDNLLAVTTTSFDIAALELFAPLLAGGRVVIASHADVLDGFSLVARIARGDITHLQATPTLWSMLLDAGLAKGPSLTMLCGGEPLPADLAETLLATGGRLWNLYGPTETTIWSAVEEVRPGQRITIGHPVAATSLHVLGPMDELLPPGAIGELNIGGAGLAKGYFGRPDLTAEAFREVRLPSGPKQLYRTGDLARRRADGRIEVLGRRDGQIKLRGFRIELGEIEAALRALPGIEAAAVALKKTPRGDQLVAYLVQPDQAFDPAPLLGKTLPAYMVPSRVVRLAALPQTANGKLDRKALPEPELTEQAQTLAVLPQTVTEQKLAAIWEQVLGGAPISVTSTIYELGADSLSVFRIAARMLEVGLGLSAKDLLQHPTIRDLAHYAERQDRPQPPSGPSLRAYRAGARRGDHAAAS